MHGRGARLQENSTSTATRGLLKLSVIEVASPGPARVCASPALAGWVRGAQQSPDCANGPHCVCTNERKLTWVR